MDLSKLYRAVSAGQAILRESDSQIGIDGKPGTYTLGVYNKAPPDIQQAVDTVVSSLGIKGGLKGANELYRREVSAHKADPIAESSKRGIFDLKVVPALVREARSRGLNPVMYITQLCLESGYGASTPLMPDGRPSYNYAGLKWNSVKTAEFVTARTGEVYAGKKVSIDDKFAVFETANDFAKAYLDYLFKGPSSYRYKGLGEAKTPLEFGSILSHGGYATDPDYATKFAKLASNVTTRYALA